MGITIEESDQHSCEASSRMQISMKNGPFFPLVYVHSFCIRSTPCSALGRHFINPRWRTSRLQNYGKRVWRRGSTRLAIQSGPRHGAHPEPLTRYLPPPGVSAPRALLTGNTRFLPNSGTRPSSGPGRRPRSVGSQGPAQAAPGPTGGPRPVASVRPSWDHGVA